LVNVTNHQDVDRDIIGVVGIEQDEMELRKNKWAVAAMAKELHQSVDTANIRIYGTEVFGMVN